MEHAPQAARQGKEETVSETRSAFTANIEEMVEFARGGIVSKTIVEGEGMRFLLFCMEAGQELSEHTASVPAAIYVVKGKARVRLGEAQHEAAAGWFGYLPAQLPHAIRAQENLTFLLVMGGGKR